MNNSIFDINKFEKIEDIIYLDEPILTHLKNGGKNYLFYLVDVLEDSDIYILFEVEEYNIYNYLTGKKSLYRIIKENENICIIIKQAFDGTVKNTDVTYCNQIEDRYMPSENSFLHYKPTPDSYYYNLYSEYELKTYFNILKENAFYIKIGVDDRKYANTIGFNELANNYITNISNSFKSFLKADFFEKFKSTYADLKSLEKKLKAMLPYLDYRMVDLQYGSFEIGLAVDNVMKGSINDKEMKAWAISVGTKYKELVLDNTFTEESVDSILKSYSVEDRKKIYEPIFKITENANVKLQIKNSKNSRYSIIKHPNKLLVEKIAPKITDKKEDEKDLQIVNITTVVDKNKPGRQFTITGNTLFSSSTKKDVPITKKDFEKYGYKLDFDISILVKIETHKNTILLNTEYDNIQFNYDVTTGKLEDGLRGLISLLVKYITSKKHNK